MAEKHILSLGAGVQSTTVYLLAMDGALDLDAAVFADTGDESRAVYKHLAWLQSLDGPPILVRSRGRLSDDLKRDLQRKSGFSSVPFFTRLPDGAVSMSKRQCSFDYKAAVVERTIRRDILGLKPRQRIPGSITIHQYIGISLDEARRTLGLKRNIEHPHFPLIDRGWTRADCQTYLATRVPHETPRSACVYCPFQSDAQWLQIQKNPNDWALAVEVDRSLRVPGQPYPEIFAHRSCLPLDQVEFRHERQFNMFTQECEGMCGV